MRLGFRRVDENVTKAVKKTTTWGDKNQTMIMRSQFEKPGGLEAIPWVKSNTSSAQVAFRATSVTPLGAVKSAVSS